MVARIRRLVKIAAGVLAFLVYVWMAAVRNLPAVKRRKAKRRAARAERVASR
jgi:hypothetical protein